MWRVLGVIVSSLRILVFSLRGVVLQGKKAVNYTKVELVGSRVIVIARWNLDLGTRRRVTGEGGALLACMIRMRKACPSGFVVFM